MNKILPRIESIANNEGITIGALERKIGASKGVLSRAIANGTDIQSKWIQAIVENYPRYSAEWLLAGKGEMIREEVTQLGTPSIQSQFSLRTDHPVDLQRVPLYELDASAGLVTLFADQNHRTPISHIQIPDLPPCDGAVYVRGDSMYPLLKSGDIVLYKEIPNGSQGILWGEMYLLSFTIDGESYISIKYIQKADDDRFVRLVSHNPHHSPKDIPADSIQALALIKASIRFNTMG
ncbi:S24 family peptidase [Millionella massiliensis]|uniref:S24 family peptidase n=1 Tax=Millionella massiliensis TaxID=1871023 RepID=UPI0023A8A629|nr:S24 family peptidase [Millionella massiliensis]